MNDKLRKLRLISRLINADLFFYVEISTYQIKFQGHFNYEIAKYLKNHKFIFEIGDDDGYVRATRGNIKIVMS